jgi:hypothetical protein
MLSFLLAAQVVAAPLQRDAVLVQGQPPLTRATVSEVESFFEWLFEAEFDAAQRRELERALVATWQGNDRKEITATVEIVEINAKLAGIAEEKRREVRAAMLPEVLKGLRAESDDFARLLLAVYESASGAAAPSSQPAGEAGDLLGSWRSTEMGMISYQNTITGASRPGRGTTMQYRFLPGGRFEYNGYLETTMYNCTTTLFNPVTGTYRVEGGRLHLTPKTSKWQQRNNCAASMNKEQPGKLDPETYTIRFAEEQGGRRLCLTSSKGNEVCYRAE